VAGSRIVVDGYKEAVAAFRKLPREASDEIRLASGRIADQEAAAIRSAASGNRQAAAAAATMRVRKDRFPAMVIGGARKVTATASAGDLLFGAEFGAAATTPGGFRPHTGTRGYFLYPTLRRDSTRMWAEWLEAAEKVVTAFDRGA
jgi:hypothetical protein